MLRLFLRHPSFLLVLLLAAVPASARTWLVEVDGSGDHTSIDEAISSAEDGDMILVGPGVYLEYVHLRDRHIELRSRLGPEVTILDGEGFRSYGFVINGGQGRETVIEGFTIRNYEVVGIRLTSGSPVIRNNVIEGNGGLSAGLSYSPAGGIFLGTWPLMGLQAGQTDTYSPLIEGNTFLDNVAANGGGGITVGTPMAPVIRNNEFQGNECLYRGGAGGIYVQTRIPGILIEGNRIEGNLSGGSGGGIGVWSPEELELEIRYNLVVDNVASYGITIYGDSGAGIHLRGCRAWVHHNTVVGNSGDLLGGGIAVLGAGSPRIEQNILAENQGGGIWCSDEATPTVENNLAGDNRPGDVFGECGWYNPTSYNNGNVRMSPLFCDPASGDYTLAASSPALTHPAGPLGAFPDAGCVAVAVETVTWGRLKTRFSGKMDR